MRAGAIRDLDWGAVLDPRGPASALVVTGSDAGRVARVCAGWAYLAVPYAGEVALKASWRLERSVRFVNLAGMAAAQLTEAGCDVLCPVIQRAVISHAAGLARVDLDPLRAEAWDRLADRMRGVASVVVVPDLQGWDRCRAIWADVAWALERDVPVHVYAGRGARAGGAA